jgi:hypothetical protein
MERAFFGSVLEGLGYKAPSEDELNDALRNAFTQLKRNEGVNPDDVKYRFALVPIDREWAEKTFE